ncbi:alpha/beta fold hydrolase [Oceanobacillus sp. Castelsardo]|uniref:alpha/beta fold hydrolase n=1 Tax=Oceanobacillus sp. Castelsardo TaxID=1851204 RepID=UPI000838EF54|nr:alpha/beta hydrolase [Oceanobacillus sp. Castelsardo]
MGENVKFLFIHGAGGTKNKWRKISEDIRNESIIIDLPNRLELSQDYSTIEDFAMILDSELNNDVIVVGHSMGGLIGLELAIRSELVKGIVLVNSHFQLPVDANVLQKLKDGNFPIGLFHASYSRDVDKQLLEEEMRDRKKVLIETTYFDFVACNQYSRGEEIISNLDIPVLAILGDQDRLLPRNTVEELKDRNPNIQINVLKNAGHHVMLETPNAFMESLKLFKVSIQGLSSQ